MQKKIPRKQKWNSMKYHPHLFWLYTIALKLYIIQKLKIDRALTYCAISFRKIEHPFY